MAQAIHLHARRRDAIREGGCRSSAEIPGSSASLSAAPRIPHGSGSGSTPGSARSGSTVLPGWARASFWGASVPRGSGPASVPGWSPASVWGPFSGLRWCAATRTPRSGGGASISQTWWFQGGVSRLRSPWRELGSPTRVPGAASGWTGSAFRPPRRGVARSAVLGWTPIAKGSEAGSRRVPV